MKLKKGEVWLVIKFNNDPNFKDSIPAEEVNCVQCIFSSEQAAIDYIDVVWPEAEPVGDEYELPDCWLYENWVFRIENRPVFNYHPEVKARERGK